ncbi:MAG TPA: hypothetical protein [Caudoviricetes sp.]|nr:MAG TPA: hypothetical protein [Caudoviricetes sp.]
MIGSLLAAFLLNDHLKKLNFGQLERNFAKRYLMFLKKQALPKRVLPLILQRSYLLFEARNLILRKKYLYLL